MVIARYAIKPNLATKHTAQSDFCNFNNLNFDNVSKGSTTANTASTIDIGDNDKPLTS